VGIPPAPRGVPQVEVTFDIDANGIVHVSAKDLGTGREQSIRVVASSGLSETEIQKMKADADAHREQDRFKKEFAELQVNADGLIYSTEKSLEEFSNLLKPEDIEEIKQNLVACKNLMERATRDNFKELKEAVTRLETAAHRIADAMYKGASDEKSQ